MSRPPHGRPPGGISTATWVLLSVTLLLSLAIHHALYEAVLDPGFQSVPAAATEPPAPVESDSDPAPSALADTAADSMPPDARRGLDVRLDQVIEFEEPPLLIDPEPTQKGELQDILQQQKKKNVHIDGKMYIRDEANMKNPELRDIEGGEIELRINTQ